MFSKETYIKRRQELKRLVGEGVVILFGNNESPYNYPANAYAPMRQDSSFLYYFGQHRNGLVGVKDIDNDEEWLFGDDIDVEDTVWMGFTPSVADLAAEVGISKTAPWRNSLFIIMNMSLMKKICLSLLVVMMAMTANAQTTWLCDSSYVVNKDGQRTAFTEYSYDNGVLLEELNTFWATSWDGQQIAEYTKTAYEYDEAGRTNKITDYEKKDDKWTVTAVEDITQFNENGDPTEIIYYEANEDDEGQLQPDSKMVATYEGRLMTQYDLYRPNKYFWLLFSTTKCEYNDQGLMTKRTTSREAFGITNVSSMTYEYDTHGNVTKEVYETDDYSFTYTYENTYDANDNLESVKEFIDGKEDDTEYFFWSIGGHTALKGVKASAGSACTWFDLNGRRLSGQPDRKGIFVRDGKKVMIK